VTDLVIGANGTIGSVLLSYLSDAVGTFHKNHDNLIDGRQYCHLDITEKQSVESLFALHKPKKVFLAAGVTSVDSCEMLESDAVNSLGVSHVITACGENSQLIFFSSSYVFDGNSQTPYKPKDEPSPINRYGRQKELTEKLLFSREGMQFLVIRTVAVFGGRNDFVSQVSKAVKEGKRIHVPVDQTVTPIYVRDLAKTAIHLSDRYSGEIFHVAGNKCITYYDFAVQIAYKLGCKKPHDLIVGVKLDDMEQLARRPKNACLDCNFLEARAFNIPSLEKGLKKFFDN
jgi:dTDP-4-dehydrorhamnose reductase